jgi:ABC-type polysaccharide/polyol phosphate transport system ATPase subunit
MTAADTAPQTARGPAARPGPSSAPAIRITDLQKTFRIPREQVNTLKEKALHPFKRSRYDQLDVLRGVSFEVGQGEFFGIVGRNGSGKSTLLKCLAGIYRADQGRIAVAGRLAPFIELGVGFNPDLTARDNVLINAVMMGLSPREARARFDAIVAFAELERFLDLKLKNYSSGMQVRLAFSTMVHTDADVLLIDEVLAVGDAAFQQKCFDVFFELRDRGKTIVLVTHDMSAVERFCHRALLLTDGRIELIGEPAEVGRRYLVRNFEQPGPDAAVSEHEAPAPADSGARADITDVWVEDATGRRMDALPHGEDLVINCVFVSHEDIDRARLDVWVDSEDGRRVFGAGAGARVFAASTLAWDEPPRSVQPGERLHVRLRLRNGFTDGRLHVGCSLLAGSTGRDIVALDNRATSFVSYGGAGVYGLAAMDHELTLDRRPPEAA